MGYFFLSEDFNLPRRIFCPLKVTWPVCACEYQFIDEGLADLIERLKEMLDIDATFDNLDTKQEIPAEIGERSVPTGRSHKVVLCVLKLQIFIALNCISRVLNIFEYLCV